MESCKASPDLLQWQTSPSLPQLSSNLLDCHFTNCKACKIFASKAGWATVKYVQAAGAQKLSHITQLQEARHAEVLNLSPLLCRMLPNLSLPSLSFPFIYLLPGRERQGERKREGDRETQTGREGHTESSMSLPLFDEGGEGEKEGGEEEGQRIQGGARHTKQPSNPAHAHAHTHMHSSPPFSRSAPHQVQLAAEVAAVVTVRLRAPAWVLWRSSHRGTRRHCVAAWWPAGAIHKPMCASARTRARTCVCVCVCVLEWEKVCI